MTGKAMWPPLVLATHGGKVGIGMLLLEYGANVCAVGPDGYTVVEAAADRGDMTGFGEDAAPAWKCLLAAQLMGHLSYAETIRAF